MAHEETNRALRITLVKSVIGHPEKHRRIVRALGLRKRERPVIRADRPEVRGMLRKIDFLVKVETVEIPKKEKASDGA